MIFHQLKLGPMANFVYVIGCDRTREVVVVDPAWDIPGLVSFLEEKELKLIGALATHYHPDHVGGNIFGLNVPGFAQLLETVSVPLHAHRAEVDGIRKVTGISASDLVSHESGDVVSVGDVNVTLLHTPGHTPGSQCFLVNNSLVSGDTLFIQACGRVDLPGGDPEQMHESLTKRLGSLPPETVLYPGHDYADRPTSTIGEELRSNPYMKMPLGDFLATMGGGIRGLT